MSVQTNTMITTWIIFYYSMFTFIAVFKTHKILSTVRLFLCFILGVSNGVNINFRLFSANRGLCRCGHRLVAGSVGETFYSHSFIFCSFLSTVQLFYRSRHIYLNPQWCHKVIKILTPQSDATEKLARTVIL